MCAKINITLSVPNKEWSDKNLSFKLQPYLRNEPSEYRQPEEIFVISDIEGDFKNFCKLLLKHGIVDKNLKWIFNDGHLVILGDCFDRGEQVIECLWLIYSLEHRARKSGGYVHFILGNHEIMNMNGDWRYIHPKYALSALNSQKPATALYDANNELWRWLRTKNIVEKIGDILFVHGGVSTKFLDLNISITDINNVARPYYTKANEYFLDPLQQLIFNSEQSPFWYRGYYQGDISEDQIDAILAKFDVKTIVTGHTIVDQVTSYYNGKVINIDVNKGGNELEGLFVKHGVFFRANKVGVKVKL